MSSSSKRKRRDEKGMNEKRIDEDILLWIMEFLLKHSTSDELFSKLHWPYVDQNVLYRKMKLLRSIRSEVLKKSISEKILSSLEALADLDKEEGQKISKSLKAAYCAVAMECTLKYLGLGDMDSYLSAVKRVRNMMAMKRELAVTDEMKKWIRKVDSAMWNVKMRNDLKEENWHIEALRLVEVYVNETWNQLDTPFLDTVVPKLRLLEEKESEEHDDEVEVEERQLCRRKVNLKGLKHAEVVHQKQQPVQLQNKSVQKYVPKQPQVLSSVPVQSAFHSLLQDLTPVAPVAPILDLETDQMVVIDVHDSDASCVETISVDKNPFQIPTISGSPPCEVCVESKEDLDFNSAILNQSLLFPCRSSR